MTKSITEKLNMTENQHDAASDAMTVYGNSDMWDYVSLYSSQKNLKLSEDEKELLSAELELFANGVGNDEQFYFWLDE
jgi:hypothetical protein